MQNNLQADSCMYSHDLISSTYWHSRHIGARDISNSIEVIGFVALIASYTSKNSAHGLKFGSVV